MTTYIATLNLPDTLNFELAAEDIAKLPSQFPATPRRTRKHQNLLPVPNLLEGLRSNPGSRASSPTNEFPPVLGLGGLGHAGYFDLEQDGDEDLSRPSVRRKLTQPMSRATSPSAHADRIIYGAGNGPLRPRKRAVTINEGIFAGAKWTAEKQQFGVNGGLINAVKSAHDAHALENYMWIGTLGMPTDALTDGQKADIQKFFTAQKRSIPVFISDANLEGHYNRYCKQILWPTFHYQIPDNPKNTVWEKEGWEHYVAVNQAFADVIVSQYKRGDTVWVNDYHLLLVPKMVREMIPHAVIGLFLHIAFPSSEVFRVLPPRVDLLEGALGSTIVGFQTKEYARHFTQTCARILSVEAVEDGCLLDDRLIKIISSPIGINLTALEKQITDPQVTRATELLQSRYANMKLIVSRDKFDRIRGLKPKMQAYERFLHDHPEWVGKVVFLQVALLGGGGEEEQLLSDVNEIVTRTNSMYGNIIYQPLVFRHQDFEFLDYLGMLCAADALFITSLREGWNLTSHEYIVCQEKGKHGLILSEFTGSAEAFRDAALLVNPWDIKRMADAIHKILEMSPEETEERWEKAFNHVKTHDATNWVDGFLGTLRQASVEQQRGVPSAIPKFNVNNQIAKYTASEKRLFVVDYEGTLVAWASGPGIVLTAQPRVVQILNELAQDKSNIVYVMSGERKDSLKSLFDQAPSVGLIAENGGFILPPRKKGSEKWIALAKNCDFSWREYVEKIFKYYQERTPGSTIEEKETSLIFHYDEADQRDAERSAKECANHINDSCPPTVHAVQGEFYVVAEPTAFTKATACQHLYTGNDRTDEDVFRWANKLEESKKVKSAITVNVGIRRTEAKSYVNGSQAIISALRSLASRSGGGLRVLDSSQSNILAGKS